MKVIAVGCLLSLLTFEANAQRLLFYVGIPQFPPVIFLDNDGQHFRGIIPDIFDSMPERDRIDVEYILHNRNRGEHALYQNDVDATMLTVEWSTQPDKLIFTDPLFKHSDFLYDDAPLPARWPSWLKTKPSARAEATPTQR